MDIYSEGLFHLAQPSYVTQFAVRSSQFADITDSARIISNPPRPRLGSPGNRRRPDVDLSAVSAQYQQKVIDQRGDQDEAVDPVEQAAEAGEPGAGVLDSAGALEARFEQVAGQGARG